MESAWQGSIVDWAAVYSSADRAVDEIAFNEYSDPLQADKLWDEEDKQFLLEPGSDSNMEDDY